MGFSLSVVYNFISIHHSHPTERITMQNSHLALQTGTESPTTLLLGVLPTWLCPNMVAIGPYLLPQYPCAVTEECDVS